MWTKERREAQSKHMGELNAAITPEEHSARSRLAGKKSWEARKIVGLSKEWHSLGGKTSGKKNGEDRLKRMTPEERKEWHSKGARARNRTQSLRRPTWPEVHFYGLVFGNPITSNRFSAQQDDGRGIYDGAWLERNIIAELDGSGHHAFRDRRAEDSRKDIARMLDGNSVLREEDENVLFLKALAILEDE